MRKWAIALVLTGACAASAWVMPAPAAAQPLVLREDVEGSTIRILPGTEIQIALGPKFPGANFVSAAPLPDETLEALGREDAAGAYVFRYRASKVGTAPLAITFANADPSQGAATPPLTWQYTLTVKVRTDAPAEGTITPGERPPAAPPAVPGADGAAPAAAAPQGPALPAATAPTPTAHVEVTMPAPADAAEAARLRAAKEPTIRFQFDGIPYADVVRLFAQMAGRPVLGDVAVPGTLTFFDSAPYTYDDAFDTLNLLLAMQGFMLIENGRFLQVVPTKDLSRYSLRILHGLEKTEGARPGEVVTIVLPLKYLDATAATAAAQRMISTFGLVSPLAKGKGLVITDRVSTIERVRALLAELDVAEMVERQLKAYPLKFASARNVAGLINNLFGGGGGGAGAAGRGGRAAQQRFMRDPQTGQMVPIAGQESAVATSFDERSNTVFLMGAPDMIALAGGVIEKLDVELGAGGEGVVPGDLRIFALQNARAEDVARTLLAAVGQPATGSSRRGGAQDATEPPTRIVADPGTNRVIVSAAVDQMAVVERLIRELDQATTEAGGTRIFRLKAADAQQLAQVISSALARPDARGRRDAGAGFSVSADPRTNALIVAGPASDIQAAASLIEELDTERTSEAREFRVIPLKAGDAAQLAPSLARLFAQQTAGSGRGAAASNLRVEAEPITNSLLISAAPGDWSVIQKILDDLSKPLLVQGPDGTVTVAIAAATTRLVPLKHAKATELAETLRELYAGAGRSRSGGRGSTPPIPVVITASERNNSLLISADADDQQAIGSLVEALDVPVSEAAEAVRIVRVKSADAVRLAATLKAMMPASSSRGKNAAPVLIEADANTNSLLLRAPDTEQKMLEDLIASLDAGTQETAREMRLIELKYASAVQVAGMLRQLYPASPASGSSRRGPPTAATEEPVVIAAAPGDRSLVVEAPRKTIEEIAQLIKTLDTADSPATVQVRSYALASARAPDLARSLGPLFAQQQQGRGAAAGAEPPARFEADAATNHLLVSATPAQFEVIEGLIQKLESAAVLAGQTRTYKLKFAKAAEVAPVLQAILVESPSGGARGAAQPPVRVAAMAQSNTVVVQGPADKMALAEQLIETFDSEEATPQSVIQIVPLKSAQAATLAQAVTAAMAEQPAGRGASAARTAQEEPQVTVTPEPNSNSVLVRGPRDRVTEAVGMIRLLDEGGAEGGVQIRVYPLKNGLATEMVGTLTKLFQGIARRSSSGRRSGEEPAFSVAADERTNSLVVSTNPAQFALVEEILKTLDQAEEVPDHAVQYVVLRNANASDVADRLRSMYADRKGVDKPIIESDFFGNAITVIAKEADARVIEPIIARLDEAAKDNTLQVRVVPMTRMRAERMAQLLERLYGPVKGGKVTLTGQPAEQPDEGGNGSRLKIMEAPRRPRGLARPAPDAPWGMLFAPPVDPAPTASSSTAAEATAAAPEKTEPAAEKAAPAPEGAEAPGVTIAVDKATNSLIISGTRQELSNLESLIEQLQPSGADEEAEYRVFKITKGDPVAVAQTIDDLFNPRPILPQQGQPQPQQPPQQRGQRGQPQQPQQIVMPKPTVVVVPDLQTRSIIVRAKPVDFEVIEPLVKHLDQKSTVVSELRVFSLKNTDAAEVATNLQELFRPAASTAQARQPGQPAQPGRRTAQRERAEQVQRMLELRGAEGTVPVDASTLVSISANRQTNSVVVAAPADAMEIIAHLVEELDQSAALTKVPVVRMYPLKAAEVASTVQAVQAVFAAPAARQGGRGAAAVPAANEAPVIVTGDEAGRLVIVSAATEKHDLIAKVIEEIDAAAGTDALAVKVYRIQYAEATGLADALQATLTTATGGGGRRGGGATVAGGIRISADASSNSLVVRASAEEHERIAKLIEEMDIAPALQYAVRTIPLAKADASAVAATLNRMFAAAPTRGGRGVSAVRQGSVIIEGDPAAKMLLVRADDEAFAKIEELVKGLDEATASTDRPPTVIALKHGDAASVASSLQQIFTPARGQRQNPEDVVTVAAEPVSNSLIVTAGEANLAKVQALLEQLDTETAGGVRTELVALKKAKAADLATVLSAVASGSTQPVWGRGRYGAPAPASARAAVVTADAASNTLVLSGPASEVDRLKEMALQLDESAAKFESAVVKVYPLKTADVQTTVTAIQQMFGDRTGGASRWIRFSRGVTDLSDEVTVAGDEVGRLVIVSAPADKHDLIAKVIEEMDAAAGTDTLAVKIYRVQNAEATGLAQALESALSKAGVAGGRRGGGPAAGPGGLRISADASSNSLVVRASEEDHERIAKLIEEMDVAPAAQYAVQTIPLKNADASTVAASLTRVFTTPGGGRFGQGAGRQNVVIEGNRDSRTLMVRADAPTFEKIQKLAQELDETSGAGQTTPTLIPLQFAQAAAIAPALAQAFAPPRGERASPENQVTVVPEPASNSLIVTASPQNMPKVEELVAKLDTEGATAVRREFLILTKAKAAELADVLSRVYGTARRGGAVTGQDVVVAADAASNALVMTGPAAELEKLKTMAKDLDQATAATAPSVYILPLKNGDAVTVSAMVRDLYSQQVTAAAKAGRSLEPLAVSSDERANALVLATSEEMYRQVQEWVGKVEEMTPARGNLRIITLQYADPVEVQNAIDRLFGQGGTQGATPVRQPSGRTRRPSGPRGPAGGAGTVGARGTGKVETTVLPEQRSILIDASDEDFETIQKLIELLDAAAASTKRQVQVFTVQNATNTQVATSLNAMYQAATPPGAPEQDRVTITALPQTRAVVVTASQEKMDEVAHLIEQLDKEEVSPQLEFRIYPLTNATPTKILPTLQQMLAQVRQARPGETVNAQADERTRSIIVTARGTLFDQVGKIIEALDKPAAFADTEVLVIKLKRADATRMAAVLNEMLQPDAAGQVTPEARELQEQVRLLRFRIMGAERPPELDLTKPIKITADPNVANQQGANALVISSTPDNLKALQAIVEILDSVPLAEGVKVRLVHLRNADAESAMTVLREIFTQGVRLGGRTGTSVAGKAEPESTSGKALVTPLNVSADVRTNTLVLSGIEESLALAEIVLKDLDRDAGKIVTDVRLFRLKHADARRVLPVLQAVFAETAAAAATPGAEGLRTQVTRLRTMLEKQEGHSTELPKTRAALTVQADVATNTLVVAARSDVMPLIADVIQTMDVPGAGAMSVVRIFPLVNADATRLKTMIDALYAGQGAETATRPEDRPTIAVDTRTNALVVTSSDKTLAVLESLVTRLDMKTPIDLRDMRLIALKNADAAPLAPILQAMMDARVERQTSLGVADAEALRTIVLADPRSNSLIVGGSKESYDLVKTLAEQLDNAGPALSGQVQVLPLKYANAGTLSTTLANLFAQRYAAARSPDLARQAPAILPELRTNALIVTANADDTRILKVLLEKLDVEQRDLAVELAVIPMKFNDAGIVGPTIQNLFQARLTSMTPPGQPPAPQDRVDVVTDSLTNALIVSASKENMVLIRALLAKVDVEPPDETGIVRMYVLKNSDVQRVAAMLQGLMAQGLYKPGIALAGPNTSLAAREKVAIAVDVRTNVLIVSASRENFKVLEEIIDRIDSGGDFTGLSDIRIYILKRADATRLGPMLQTFFNTKRAGEQAAGGVGPTLPVVILADQRTNALVVAGTRETFTAVEQMIQKLDGDQTLMGADFRVFFLKQAVATSLQPTLQTLFAQRIERDTTKDPVTVVADPRTNAVIVGASPEDMALAENLISRLDAVPLPGSTLQVFPLSKSDALQVANTLRSLYQAEGAAAAAAVGISVDTRLNAIVVSAGPADMQRIADLVRQLDTATVTQVTEIRIVSLENADATELARILTDALNNKPPTVQPGGPMTQALLQFVTRTKDGRELVTSALQEGVLITPDARSNAIVVSAPVENMPLLESLIEAMDSTQPRLAEIRVITLQNADAAQTAQILSDLFRAPAAGGGAGANAQKVRYTLSTTGPEGEKSAAAATLGSAEQYALSVTVDARTNSLLIGGTRRYVDLCTKVVESLDSSPAQERQTTVYRLRNAQAADIETALTQFLTQERQRITATLGADAVGAAQRLLEREVAVVAESTSNTLVLSASPRYFSTITHLVEELDQPPPQVLIQVLLVEVTLDDTLDFGMDWNFTDVHQGSRRITTTGGTNFGVQGDIANGGFSVTVTGGDLQYFLRALESEGRLEVLSRPQILASDNQLATINIGQRVPFITSSRITEQGTTFNTIEYQPVGIILNVTPRINPDGFVKLQVNPEISALSSSSIQISETVSASIINNRSAETTVTVQDGHTIIIGGLITTRNDDRERKIPLLGDIPILGHLFKTTTKTKERTELLIILTPEVLRTVPHADQTTVREVKKLTLPKAVQEDGLRDTMLDPDRVYHPDEVEKKGVGGPAPSPDAPAPDGAQGGRTPPAANPAITIIPGPEERAP